MQDAVGAVGGARAVDLVGVVRGREGGIVLVVRRDAWRLVLDEAADAHDAPQLRDGLREVLHVLEHVQDHEAVEPARGARGVGD
eukprot:299662-Prymnesium_polylepis.1